MTATLYDKTYPSKTHSQSFYAATVVFAIFFLAEVSNAFVVKQGKSPFFLTVQSKMLLEVIFLAHFCSRLKISAWNLKIFLSCGFLLLTSYVGSLIFNFKNPDFVADYLTDYWIKLNRQTYQSVAFFWSNQCLFFFLCFVFLRDAFNAMSHREKKCFFRFYEYAVCFFCFTSILGFITEAEIFRTYPGLWRWGYNGLLPYTNASSGFWLIAFFYGMFLFVQEKRKILLVVSLIAMGLAGAKSLWLLAAAGLGVFVLKFFSHRSKIILLAGGCFALLVVSATASFWFPALRNEIVIIDDIIFAVQHGGDILQIITSNRLNLSEDTGRISNLISTLEVLTPFNWLFGGLGGRVNTEMAIFDMPLTFGIIGIILYAKRYFLIFKPMDIRFRNFFTIFYFGTAFGIGWLFNTPSLAPYLSVLVLKLSQKKGASYA
jgi:hypothetical protein